MLVCRRGEADCAYEASEIVGVGSFGTVYLGEDAKHPGRTVALKSMTFKSPVGDTSVGDRDSQGWKDAVEEAKMHHKFQHPSILRCHEWFEEEQSAGNSGCVRTLWMVLDYMDGGDMCSFYKSKRQALAAPAEAPFVRRFLCSIGGALGHIHDMGALHRDVKCANVLLSSSLERIVLADFGLACFAADIPEPRPNSERGQAVGTLSYLAPEVLCGQQHSAHSDAWALGVCTFRASALERPFEARDETTLMMKIVSCPPAELPRSCPADVACAILSLLSQNGYG